MVISLILRFTGRLALSRGLGDFEYKKNADLGPEDQITTANPDVLVHHISNEDEFLVLASDGKQRYPVFNYSESGTGIDPSPER